MSIYATNRMGRSSVATITANESYKSNDIGRILYESQVNDMAIFEAVVASDMRECQAIREGTLLESEIVALNEKSVKEFFQTMLDKLKAFWRKIKGVFRDVMQKIAAYIVKDGKAYVTEFDAAYKELGGKDSDKVKLKYFELTRVKLLSAKDIEDGIVSNTSTDTSRTEIIQKALGEVIGLDSVTPKEFKEKFAEKTIDETEKTVAHLKYVLADKGSADLKKLKDLEKDVDKKLQETEKMLKDLEREANGKEAGPAINRVTMLVNVFESVSATTVGAAITAVKGNIRNARVGLHKALIELKKKDDPKGAKEEEVLHNSAIIEAAEEVEAALDDSIEVAAADAETQAAIDEVLDDADDGAAAASDED